MTCMCLAGFLESSFLTSLEEAWCYVSEELYLPQDHCQALPLREFSLAASFSWLSLMAPFYDQRSRGLSPNLNHSCTLQQPTVKYIDDASQARSINLKRALSTTDTSNRPRPLEYWEHTGYILKQSHNDLQKDLNDLKVFTDQNLMIINQKKTLIMKFNFHKTLDFPPLFNFGNGPNLETVSQTKILGIILSSSLKWSAHVDYMVKKANKKIWILRKLKQLDLDTYILVDFYCKEIRSILEFGVVVWQSGLTIKMRDQLERVQKICINIILCEADFHVSYRIGCTLLNLEPLHLRRQDLCVKFIQKASLDPRHSDLFVRNEVQINTRKKKPIFKEFSCRNKRFFDSPLCYLTRLLNKNPTQIK